MSLDRFKVKEGDQVLVREQDLRRTVTEILQCMGLGPDDVSTVTDMLVMADLRGIESHGVSNTLRSYVKDFRNQRLNPAPGYLLIRQTAATAVIDAEQRLGLAVGCRAMQLAIDKASKTGVGVVALRNSGHLGAVGYFTRMAAERDMVGLFFGCSGMPTPSVVPTFAAEPMFGTNPISIAAPTGREAPLLFDIATSVISGNKVRLAVRLQEPLLPRWVADRDGSPLLEETLVVDRNQFSLLPLGSTRELSSHKGYGLSLMTEVLATLLSGGLPIMLDPGGGAKGHFIAYDLRAFGEVEDFRRRLDQVLEHLRTARPAPGQERVLYPGLLEDEQIQLRRERGIPLHSEVIDWFVGITAELGLEPLKTITPQS